MGHLGHWVVPEILGPLRQVRLSTMASLPQNCWNSDTSDKGRGRLATLLPHSQHGALDMGDTLHTLGKNLRIRKTLKKVIKKETSNLI